MTRRRTLLSFLGVLAAPRALRAQLAPRKLHRIGVVGLGATADIAGPTPALATVQALVAGLRELGYVYGQHYVIEGRGAGAKQESFPALAADLVQSGVDLIVAAGPALPALSRATSTIPIVMTATNDPVAEGYVDSLARPGRNLTGFSLQSVEATGKQLELMKEILPGEGSLAVIWSKYGAVNLREVESLARKRGWRVHSLEIRETSEVYRALRTAADARASCALVYASAILYPHAKLVGESALRLRVPTMFPLDAFVDAGGLISYGPDIEDIWRRAAVFVDRILKGASPRELPIEQPTKFELVVNLRTAKALGVAIPRGVLLRADRLVD
jgi:putative ABC transport system substrate-binding protein